MRLHGHRPTFGLAAQMNFGMKKNTCWLFSAIALGVSLAAGAQATLAEPAAAAPALRYQSAFSEHTSWQELQPGDWRAANDAVSPKPRANAGHGAASAPAPAVLPQASPPPKPDAAVAPAHGGHHMHGGQK